MKQKNKKNDINKVLIALLLLLATGFGYYYTTTSKKLKTQEKNFAREKLEIKQSLDEMEAQYNLALEGNTAMKSDLESAKEALLTIKEELKKTKANDYSAIKKYKRQLATLRKQNQRLFFLNDSLNQANAGLNIALDSTKTNLEITRLLKDSIANENSVLSDKVLKGSKLNISKIKTEIMRERGNGKFKATDKARKTDLLKISYTIIANPIADKGEKKAYVQVIDPTGKIISSKGEITLADENTIKYSAENVFDYVNVDRNIIAVVKVDKNTMKAGKYTVRSFIDGKLAGHSNFDLR